mgnify:CR=1 FL=1
MTDAPYIYRTVKVSKAERPTVRVVQQTGRANVSIQKGSPNSVRVTSIQRNVRVLSDLAGVAAALNERLQAVIEDGGRTALQAPRTTGSATDYSLVTAGAPIINLYDGLGVALTPHVSNDAPPVTLTVDSTATKPVKLSTSSGYQDLPADILRQGVPVVVHYSAAEDAWVVGADQSELLPGAGQDIIDAQNSANQALADAGVATELGQRAPTTCLKDEYFSEDGYQVRYGGFEAGETLTFSANEVYPAGQTLTIDITANDGTSPFITSPKDSWGVWTDWWDGVANQDAYVVEMEFELVSGSLDGLGFALYWNDSTGSHARNISIQDHLRAPVQLGQRNVFRAVFRRPSGHDENDFTDHNFIIWCNNGSFGGQQALKTVKLHRLSIRPATNMETTVEDIDDNLVATMGFRVQAGSAVSLLDLVALDGAGTSVSLARISADQIVLDGTVTADLIQSNSITTDKLLVGYQGNLLDNSDWSLGLHGLEEKGFGELYDGRTNFELRQPPASFSGSAYPTFMMRTVVSAPTANGAYEIAFGKQNANGGWAGAGAGYPVPTGSFVEFHVRISNHRCAVKVGLYLYDTSGAYAGAHILEHVTDEFYGQSDDPNSWERRGGIYQLPSNVSYARPFARIVEQFGTDAGGNHNAFMFLHQPYFGITSGQSANFTEYTPSADRVTSGQGILASSITADKLNVTGQLTASMMSADVFDAGNITAGTMNARHIEVTELLEIDAITAGFAMGKVSAFDDADGIYMGRTNDDGTIGFGLAFSRTEGGTEQSIKATSKDGLKITNAKFYRNLETPNPFTAYTDTSQVTTVSIPAGTVAMTLELAAAGGGGAAGVEDGGSQDTPAAAGGNTVVELHDDSGLIQTWTATGGAAGVTQSNFGAGLPGESSSFGTGGAGGGYSEDGYVYDPGSDSYVLTYAFDPGENATGYGAGGGGGAGYDRGTGGHSGQIVSFEDIDVTGLSNPYIEITVGAGGSGGVDASSDGADGGDGSQGRVRVKFEDNEPLPANVIPFAPTSTGTMSSDGPFPDLGAGLWVLTREASNWHLYTGDIEIDDNGSTVKCVYGGAMSFVSAKTPVLLNTPYAARDWHYQFYKMGD